MTGGKPIKITLFHAEWCGHCVDFKPTWEKMKVDKDANKNIEFEEYEASVLPGLPEELKKVNGEEINGFPTIKINVSGKDYNYKGARSKEDIYGFVIDHLKDNTKQNDNQQSKNKNNKVLKRATVKEEDGQHYQMGGGEMSIGTKKMIRTLERKLKKDDLMIVGF
jgi:thiol-disulfide isomerase/thioredoxin